MSWRPRWAFRAQVGTDGKAIIGADLHKPRDVEMHLVSRCAQSVTVADCDFRFRAGESIHTESSRRFEIGSFRDLVIPHGWRVGRVWTDDRRQFALFGLDWSPPVERQPVTRGRTGS